MAQKIDMTFGEWMLRVVSKTIALGAVLFGLVGMWIVVQDVLDDLLMHGAYGRAACVGILCIAVNFGLTPLALDVDKQILNMLGLKPLEKPSKDQEKQEAR